MERKQRSNENEPSSYDPFPYWSGPRSTLLGRIHVRLSALRELWLPDSQSDTVGKDAEISTRSMHRALKVPEIINLVFKSDLSDRDLPYWEIGRIDQDTWRRFLAISNKITTIDVNIGAGDITFDRIKRATQSFNGLGEPFSHLRTLRIESKRWDMKFMNGLSLATVPSLTHVFVDSRYPKQDIMDWVCNDVPVRAPNVTNLVLERVSEVNAEASRYTALNYLQIKGGFRSRLWESLASCPVLEKIVLVHCTTINSVNHPEDLEFVWLVDYVYFPALHTLKIRLGSPSITVALILRSRMPMLERLCCDAQSAPSIDENL
ncbi:hypothetical protein FRC00_003291, partial [Tulasnella sp. 408]